MIPRKKIQMLKTAIICVSFIKQRWQLFHHSTKTLVLTWSIHNFERKLKQEIYYASPKRYGTSINKIFSLFFEGPPHASPCIDCRPLTEF